MITKIMTWICTFIIVVLTCVFTYLTLWRRNYFFLNFSTPCIQNVNNSGTKQFSIMKQTAF